MAERRKRKGQRILDELGDRFKRALLDARQRPGSALLDATRGGMMGVTTDVLGYPVDVATMALRPLGYSVENPVGGSQWLANRLTSPTGSPAEMAGRTLTGFLTPGPDELLRLAGVLPNTLIRGAVRQSPNLPELDLTVFDDFKKLQEQAAKYGESVNYGTWAFTDPAGKTYMLSEPVRRAMGSKASDLEIVVNEQAVRKVTQILDTEEGEKFAEEVLEAARRGDSQSVSQSTIDLVRKLDRGTFGQFNEATIQAEVLAAELRAQELAAMAAVGANPDRTGASVVRARTTRSKLRRVR